MYQSVDEDTSPPSLPSICFFDPELVNTWG